MRFEIATTLKDENFKTSTGVTCKIFEKMATLMQGNGRTLAG